ncbi:MAG: IS5 family transposase [Marinomonas primoryensis]|jgi:IS5 family transposase
MSFRHLLEKYKLSRQLFKEVNKCLSNAGIYLKEGTIFDASIIEAASSTKNKGKERDPEMRQTQKGKQWFFGLKAHIGVDARTGLTHSVITTAANAHDFTEAANLLHGEACFVSADSGYGGAQKREELKDVKADWLIAAIFSKRRASKIRIFKKHPRKNKQPI